MCEELNCFNLQLNNKIVDASVLVDVDQIGWVNHVKSLCYVFYDFVCDVYVS